MHTVAELPKRRFTVDEYFRMGEFGILSEGGVELIDGEVVEKNARGTPHVWTVDEYVQLGQAGIISDEERTELIDGEIICMTPIGHEHVYVVDLLTRYLSRIAHETDAVLRVQGPLRFNPVEYPQPDLSLLRPHEDRYRSREAGPWDALLVVEVADSSMAHDRDVKAPLYARAAIPEYCIVDVHRRTVIVHADPVGGEYTNVREFRRGDAWSSPGLGGREVRGEDVLGPE